MTTAQKERIEYLRGKNDSYAAIAADLGMSENTVKSYCRRNNIGIAIKDEQPVTTSTCANCGCPLRHTRGSKQKRFCSDQCRMAWWKAHPEAVNRRAVYHFVCPICGTEFESYGNARRRYCSRTCFGRSLRACHE
jgi:endogenous inhibitor of DNA gyrase (YacG/DUF329 family)